jgi:metal-sulfur cluster biosynthetic enzyme
MLDPETAIPQTQEAPVSAGSVPATHATTDTASNEAPSEDDVLEALKSVIDPELGINIVDLGLVYEVDIAESGDVDIQYTLTTMGCPIGPLIEDQMRAFLAPVPGIGEVRPEMVLRPAWSPEMMSEEAKAALGMF